MEGDGGMRGCTLEARRVNADPVCQWALLAVTSVVKEERAARCVTRPGERLRGVFGRRAGKPKVPPTQSHPRPQEGQAKVPKREAAGT